jgi:aminopeptidase-like protein/aminoglycoside N3'-acetyltransferase
LVFVELELMIQKGFDYNQEDLLKAICSVGVNRGDIVFSHVGMSKLGSPKELHEGKTKFDIIYGAIREAIGPEGTLFAPTYTYSFCKGEIFDPLETPSQVGYFGEALRKLKGAKRSVDPIFSVAGIGPQAEKLLENLPHDCFGTGSFLDRLGQVGAKQCNIGVSLHFTSGMHYLEQLAKVPYRFPKLFSGYIKENGKLVKQTWLYAVLVLGKLGNPMYERIETDEQTRHLWLSAKVGLGHINCIGYRQLYDFLSSKLAQDPWYFFESSSMDIIASERTRVGIKEYDIDLPRNANIEQIVRSLWYLPRDIVSDGYDAALQALSKQVPMTIHEYPTGTECFTWFIPEKWTCHEAYLETMDGRRLFSHSNNPLHVVSYSLPFEGEVIRDELFKHLHIPHKLSEAIPFVHKYYERDWGLCCSRAMRESLTDERYRVVVKADFSYSTLKVGEVVVPGKSEECFVLCAHLCHPCMVNDDMAGVAVGIDVMRELLKRKKLHYTYRFIILPETIGSAAYLSHNEKLIPKMIGGLFLEMLGTRHHHMLKPSIVGDAQIDECIHHIVKEHDPQVWLGDPINDLLNDERMFNAPGVGVPMLSLSRTVPKCEVDSPYKEYHSSFDTPENADFPNMYDSRDLVLKIIDAIDTLEEIHKASCQIRPARTSIDALEENRIPKPKFKGELFCSRFEGIDYSTMEQDIFNIIFRLDGYRTIADIAQQSGMNSTRVKEILDILQKEKLIDWA